MTLITYTSLCAAFYILSIGIRFDATTQSCGIALQISAHSGIVVLEARIEKKLTTHGQAIAAMLSAIRQLLNPPRTKRRPIGFTADLDEKA
jgi:hypothetical protein